MSASQPASPAAPAAPGHEGDRWVAYQASKTRVVETDTAYREADGAWFYALYLAYGDDALERQHDAIQTQHPKRVRELADVRTLAFAEAATAMAHATTDPDAYLRWAWARFLTRLSRHHDGFPIDDRCTASHGDRDAQ